MPNEATHKLIRARKGEEESDLCTDTILRFCLFCFKPNSLRPPSIDLLTDYILGFVAPLSAWGLFLNSKTN